jgi:hypothetical protein
VNLQVKVWVRDAAGNLVSDWTTPHVAANPSLAPQPVSVRVQPLMAVEGQAVPAGTVLASFSDPGSSPLASTYAALVDWGDGSPVEIAAVNGTARLFWVVPLVPHTYADTGAHTLTVSIFDVGAIIPIAIGLGSAPVQVADAPLTPSAVPTIMVTKGAWNSNLLIGSFQDANPAAQPSNFTAMIDWGDGTAWSTGQVSQPAGRGTAFQVRGDHRFLAETTSPRNVSVHLHDEEGRELALTASVQVRDAAPVLAAIPVKMTRQIYFNTALVNIFEPNGSLADAALPTQSAPYYATINWGDGTATTAGQIVLTAGGYYQVLGGHTYKGMGPYTVTVTVTDPDGGTVTTTTTIFDPPAQASARRRGAHPARNSPHKATPRGPHALAGAFHNLHSQHRAQATRAAKVARD